MRYLKIGLVLALAVFLAGFGYVYFSARSQGAASVDWAKEAGRGRVSFDEDGIPTLEAADWDALLELQGFVEASERLWQMDLMRRSGAGRLAEWFGAIPRAVEWDVRRRNEDWASTAQAAVRDLPEHERRSCELFAEGVNRFIRAHRGKWGVEYTLLGEVPEPWKCEDSILILMSMVEDLTSTTEEEVPATLWQRRLPADWRNFLFPQNHPWNKPLFSPTTPGPQLPQRALKARPIVADEIRTPLDGDEFFPGSNAWVYRGSQGTFIANDPHLNYSVPQLWYALRLKVSEQEWVAGAAIPGLPGVVLGRNANLAWGFTNAKEDIDDLLEETIHADGKRYLARAGQWRAIEERPYTIRVRAAPEIRGVARFTHRGPLNKIAELGEGIYSRQWLAFKPGMLRLPALAIMRARNWDDFNRAADDFRLPSQAVVFADRRGGIGVRLSGRSVKRRVTGLVVQPALQGEWLGIEPASQRPRKYLPAGTKPDFISTANQRLWVSSGGEHWSSDLRQDRIVTALSAPDLTRADMERIQIDTQLRYFKVFADWLCRNAETKDIGENKILERWRAWDGDITSNEKTFAQIAFARGMLAQLVLGRVRAEFGLPAAKDLAYDWKLRTAWELSFFENSKTWEVFGLSEKQTAQWLLKQVAVRAIDAPGYSQVNRWKAQHPFVHGAPLIGRFFKVEEYPQPGFSGVVRVERPLSGATTRLVWDLHAKDGGSWIFPVGQSGHVASPRFKSLQAPWHQGTVRRPVWPAERD